MDAEETVKAEEGADLEDMDYHILVVDDEQEVQEVLKTVLEGTERFDCEVSTAGDADEALEVLDETRVDLIIADQKMPGKNGTELLKDVKERSPRTIRILITGYSDLDTAKSAINEAQVHRYLEKPWDNQDMIKTVEMELDRLLERQRSDVVEVENVVEAIDAIEKVKENLSSISSHPGVFSIPMAEGAREGRQDLMLKFDSASDFNKFSYELKHNQDLSEIHEARIEDVQVFNKRYIVTVSLKP